MKLDQIQSSIDTGFGQIENLVQTTAMEPPFTILDTLALYVLDFGTYYDASTFDSICGEGLESCLNAFELLAN